MSEKLPPDDDPPDLSASMSPDLDLLDTITPDGRGKRLDATLRDAFEEKKVSVGIPMKPKE